MCGRFTLSQSADTLADAFQLATMPELTPRYNIAPTQLAPVVRRAEATTRQFQLLHWGLIPSWAKDPKMGARLINARAETLAEKPSFRAAFKRRRCLVLADGFYEWQPQESSQQDGKQDGKQDGRKQKGRKQPFYFQLTHHQPFAFAGLWETWEGNGDRIDSCTIITTEANDLTRPVHDRMPVILSADCYDLWLDPDVQQPERLQPLLQPYDADAMRAYPVSSMVNSPKQDSPDCIQPIPQS